MQPCMDFRDSKQRMDFETSQEFTATIITIESKIKHQIAKNSPRLQVVSLKAAKPVTTSNRCQRRDQLHRFDLLSYYPCYSLAGCFVSCRNGSPAS